jgi:putative PIN family toxin of toxin-antitoxin system
VKIVLDMNVFVSGIFFGGTPGEILQAWQDGRIELAVSLEIFAEYDRVCDELVANVPNIDPAPFLTLVTLNALFYDCPPLDERVCADPDDDKFIACAIASGCQCAVSGDKLLLAASGYHAIEVLRPRDFVERYLVQES